MKVLVAEREFTIDQYARITDSEGETRARGAFNFDHEIKVVQKLTMNDSIVIIEDFEGEYLMEEFVTNYGESGDWEVNRNMHLIVSQPA